ncbi:hypothetical protein LCGC14_1127240 [marine sediment metagenome]|uniref:Uncharacterized protein n=1 Tax=marine sediment metagenome TaxID=412755 RepID=A0A0F9M290_9ZZZZ
MVEWLSERVQHGPNISGGSRESRGPTFREQDEMAKKEKIRAKKEKAEKRKAIDSKIQRALNLLKEAILLEMDEMVEKHKEKCKQCKNE